MAIFSRLLPSVERRWISAAVRGANACRRQSGAALVIAILALAILTVIGIALLLVTGTESRVAANEWSVNRAFYAADGGIRWATVEMRDPRGILGRPEFATSAFGTISFDLPSHRVAAGVFGGDGGIAVRIEAPSLLGRRPAPGGRINEGDGRAQYFYAYEVRSFASDPVSAEFSRALVAEVEIGPLPGRLPF